MKIYLAHPFEIRHEIREWQEKTKIEGVEWVNPFYDLEEDDIKEIDRLDITRKQIGDGEYVANPESIVPKDIEGLRNCDAIMCLWTEDHSIGVPMETVYAWHLGLKVYSVCLENEYHPWVQFHSDMTFLTLDFFADFLTGKR